MKILAAAVLLVAGGILAADDVHREPIQPYKLWNQVPNTELKKFTAPTATRYELSNGMVVFLLEDHELPIIDVSMTIKAGEIHEPPELAGISGATAAIMRTGGSKKYPGDKLDELLENMAASIHVSGGQDSGGASLSCLKENFDQGLEMFVDVLRNPEFPEAKIDLHINHMRTGIDKRNDAPGSIIGREFRKAMYGKDSPYARVIEHANVDKINRSALAAHHEKVFHPNMFIMGVAGDFKKEEMLAKLKAAFEPWAKAEVPLPKVPEIPTEHVKRTLWADKASIPQTTIMMGHMVPIKQDHKDYAAVQMMNEILSGSMSARMFTEVRTKKGLAYSVQGAAQVYFNRPGLFYCAALTRNEQATETVNAMAEEVIRLKDKGVTDAELDEARQGIINSYVFKFDSPSKIIGRQMTYEFYGYPMDFAEKQMEAIKKVTVADVNRVAAEYLDPSNMQLLGVGNMEKVDAAKSFLSLPGVQKLDIKIPPREKQ